MNFRKQLKINLSPLILLLFAVDSNGEMCDQKNVCECGKDNYIIKTRNSISLFTIFRWWFIGFNSINIIFHFSLQRWIWLWFNKRIRRKRILGDCSKLRYSHFLQSLQQKDWASSRNSQSEYDQWMQRRFHSLLLQYYCKSSSSSRHINKHSIR